MIVQNKVIKTNSNRSEITINVNGLHSLQFKKKKRNGQIFFLIQQYAIYKRHT